MAIVASGQVSIQHLVDEFGGTAPHNLTEYYRGGAFVDDVANNNGVPTSGQISLGNFYGAGNSVTITVTQGSSTVALANLNGYCQVNKAPRVTAPFNDFLPDPTSTVGSKNPNLVNGVSLQAAAHHVQTKGTPARFFVTLAGTRAQTFFTAVQFQSKGVFTTASATHFFQADSSTCWVWDNETIGSWDGTGNLTVTFT